MRRSKLWHRLRGHRISLLPFDPRGAGIVRATQVIHECSCGDRWVFNALGMYETHLRWEDPT